MVHDFTTMAIIGAGIIAAGAGFYYLLSNDARPDVVVGSSTEPPAMQWPMQRSDPNIVNAYNRAKYKDNTLRISELYDGQSTNFTSDFLATYAPTIKQQFIPIQQL
jgi:hypothetical protein